MTARQRVAAALRRNEHLLAAWVVTRLLVGFTIVFSHSVLARGGTLRRGAVEHLNRGILGWDAQRYLQIAEEGYAALPKVELRFFPLVPMITRALDVVLPGGADVPLLLQANVAAFALGWLVLQLVRHERGEEGEELGATATWLILLTPAAFVYAWGYTEALWGVLCVGLFLMMRTGRWWWACVFGVLVGLTRPVAPLLALPILIEAARGWRAVLAGAGGWRALVPRAAAVASPVVGVGLYLAWVGVRFGNALYPYTVQQDARFRGSLTDPVSPIWRTAEAVFDGAGFRGGAGVAAMRVGWAVVLVALVVLAFRWWPASYGAFAAAMLLVALSTERLGSFERYGFSAFPVVLAAAVVVTRRPAWRPAAMLAGGASMVGYGTLALIGAYVP